jgi:flagellar FliJ protein
MSFRFGLESVLKHRHRLEEVAQREFAEAQAAVDRCLAEIESMYQRLDEVREEISAAQMRGSAGELELIREMETFVTGQKVRIERLRLKAQELLMIAEEKHEALIFAAQEHKVMVKLKEKKFTEYRTWLARMEAKELDDVVSARTARRKK